MFVEAGGGLGGRSLVSGAREVRDVEDANAALSSRAGFTDDSALALVERGLDGPGRSVTEWLLLAQSLDGAVRDAQLTA